MTVSLLCLIGRNIEKGFGRSGGCSCSFGSAVSVPPRLLKVGAGLVRTLTQRQTAAILYTRYGLIPEICRTLVTSMFLRGRLCPALAVTCGLALSATAQARELVIIVMPPPVFSPPVFHPQPPPLTPPDWTPPLPAEGPHASPPRPECYASERVCALERPDMLGGTCACPAANGSVTGRALIPPSRHFGP
jgi:hypothetical protein